MSDNIEVKAQAALKIAEMEQQAQQFRRTLNWKINLGLWTGLFIVTYFVRGLNCSSDLAIMKCLSLFFVPAVWWAHVRMQIYSYKKNMLHMQHWGTFVEFTQRELGLPQVFSAEEYVSRYRNKSAFSSPMHLVVVVITTLALLCLTIVLWTR